MHLTMDIDKLDHQFWRNDSSPEFLFVVKHSRFSLASSLSSFRRAVISGCLQLMQQLVEPPPLC